MTFPENIRCKNCKHFKRPFGYGHPDYDQAEIEKEFGECKLAESDMGIEQYSGTLAYASDSDNYWATLNVSPEFGCVQFQEVKE